MAFSVFSENLRVYNAEQFLTSVSQTGPTNIYLTFGKPTPWPNDAAPIQANSSVTVFNDVWKNMIGAKLITGNDIRHVIPRHDWTANTVYDMYDHCTCSLILFDANVKFFVVTSDWNVYKCLNNNNGAPSTIMPTQTVINSSIQEADNYVWKYMYTVSESERLRFTTEDYIPVRTLTVDNNSLQWKVQENAVDGGIEAIKVLDGGSGYSNAANITVTITGDGRDAVAVATIDASNSIDQILLTNPGSSYTFANVSVTGDGVGGNFRAMISPPGGHGSDPVRELGGSYILLNPRLVNTEGGNFSTDNEFRQVSILQDPKEVSGDIANGISYSQTLQLILSPGSVDYIQDEVVYQGLSIQSPSFTGVVSSWDKGNNVIKLTNVVGDIQSSVLTGINSAAIRFVEAITRNKELLDYSGNLLYIDNVSPIKRADDQTEDFKIVVKF
jgi:hypothetical protein